MTYPGDANIAGSRSTITISVLPVPTIKVTANTPSGYPFAGTSGVGIKNEGSVAAYNLKLTSTKFNVYNGSPYTENLGTLAPGKYISLTIKWGGVPFNAGENTLSAAVNFSGGTASYEISFVGKTGP